MKKILFVCTGNTCRSPMAEVIFNTLCKENDLPFIAKSAGVCTITGLPMSENSFDSLKEIGIEASEFTSTSIDELNLEDFDLFAVMSENHKKVLVDLFSVDEQKIRVLSVADPYGGSLGVYRLCRDEIAKVVKKIIDDLGDEDESRDTQN